MKFKLIGGLCVLACGMVVSAAGACPEESKAKGKVQTVADAPAQADAHKACSGHCIHPCDPANCDHACDPAKCGHHAQATSSKGGCDHAVAKLAAQVHDGRSEEKPESDTVKSGHAPCGAKIAAAAMKEKKGECHKPCGSASTAAVNKAGQCPICQKVHAVLASLPELSYRVDGQNVHCSKKAENMAEKTGTSIEFVVGEEVFSDKAEAMAKLTSLLEEEVTSLQTLQFVAGGKCHRCPMTARSVAKASGSKITYRVGGVDFDTKEAASKALEAVQHAVADVHMSYKVDGQLYGCDKMASAKCKETGKKMTYIVGDDETPCSTTAKLMLTESKARTIVEAAAAALYGVSSS